MPHKKAVIPFWDEVDETAQFLESVNTIFNDNGKLRGFSTDGTGATARWKKTGQNWREKDGSARCGWCSKSHCLCSCTRIDELVLLNRTPQKLAGLAETLNQKSAKKLPSPQLPPTTSAKPAGRRHTD
jgi:shikimate 5-dehydrogenase